jgi:hypothetical protein
MRKPMGKHKNKQKQAKQRREQKRAQRNTRRPEGGAPVVARPDPLSLLSVRLPPLDPPAPQRCLPAIVIDATGKVLADPYAALGVPRDADEETVLAAWRAKIVQCPPERDPEGARRLLEARERLLDSRRVIERELGALHVPDPQAFGLPGPAGPGDTLSAQERLVGQLALYALLEGTEGDRGGPQLTMPLGEVT